MCVEYIIVLPLVFYAVVLTHEYMGFRIQQMLQSRHLPWLLVVLAISYLKVQVQIRGGVPA